MNTFDHLERLAKKIIEGPFERLFKPRFHPTNLLPWLAEAMEAGKVADGQGGYLVPNDYRIMLNIRDHQAWRRRSNFEQEMTMLYADFMNLMTETHCRSLGVIKIQVEGREDLALGHFQILVEQTSQASNALTLDKIPKTKKLAS